MSLSTALLVSHLLSLFDYVTSGTASLFASLSILSPRCPTLPVVDLPYPSRRWSNRCAKNKNKLCFFQAEAYVMDRQFARAIRAYLALAEHQSTIKDTRSESRGGSGARNSGGGDAGEGGEEGTRYAHVFRMIEQHSLLDAVKVGRLFLFIYLFS